MTLVTDNSILRHLPARAMTARSNTATTRVTPMGTFLSLMHLRLRPGDKLRGRGTAGQAVAQKTSPQLFYSPRGASNTLKYSHKAQRGGTVGHRLSSGGAFLSYQGFFRAA